MNPEAQRLNLIELVKDQLAVGVLAHLPEILRATQTTASTAVSAAGTGPGDTGGIAVVVRAVA